MMFQTQTKFSSIFLIQLKIIVSIFFIYHLPTIKTCFSLKILIFEFYKFTIYISCVKMISKELSKRSTVPRYRFTLLSKREDHFEKLHDFQIQPSSTDLFTVVTLRYDRVAVFFFFPSKGTHGQRYTVETALPCPGFRCNGLLCGELFYGLAVTHRVLRPSNHAGYSPCQMGLLRNPVYTLYFLPTDLHV